MAISQKNLLASLKKSISINNFDALIQEYESAMKLVCREPVGGFNSEDLKIFLKNNNIWPPLANIERFSDDEPDLAISYMWRGISLQEISSKLRERCRNLKKDFTLWIDTYE